MTGIGAFRASNERKPANENRNIPSPENSRRRVAAKRLDPAAVKRKTLPLNLYNKNNRRAQSRRVTLAG